MMLLSLPTADDMVRFAAARDYGVIAPTVSEWYLWGARPVSMFIDHLFGAIGPQFYPAFLIFCAACLVASITFFLSVALEWTASRSFVAAGAFAIFYAAGSPNPADVWFWSNGAVEYHLSSAIAIVACAACVANGKAFSRALAVVAIAASFLAPLAHETIGAAMLLAMFLIALLGHHKKTNLIACAVGAMSLMVSVGAPGHAVRRSYYPDAFSISDGVTAFIVTLANEIAPLLLQPATLVAGLVAAAFLPSPRRRVMWIVTLVVMALLLVFIPCVGMGAGPGPRIVNIAYAMILASIGVSTSGLMPQRRNAAAIAACVAVLASGNLPNVTDDLAGPAQAHYASLMDRERILAASEDRRVAVPALVDKRRVRLPFDDGKSDSGFWINIAIARYYKKDSISVR